MLNKATLIGRIGKKDTKTLQSGEEMTTLSIATSKKFNDSKGQQQEVTTWHNVNFFNKLSEIASKYAHVGNLIYIEGEIVNKKVDENWYYSVTGRDLKLLPSSKRDTPQENPKLTNGSRNQSWDIPEDGIPF